MFGLLNLSGSEKFALKSVNVNCDVHNLIVKCNAILVYKNETNQDNEALFMFPVEDSYVLSHIDANVGGRTVIGCCKEISEAKKMVPSREQKAVVVQYDSNSFKLLTFRIGIIPRNSEVKINMIFAMELGLSPSEIESDVDQFALQLPWILKPYQTSKVSDGAAYQVDNAYHYGFEATITGTKTIKTVFASNYQLALTFNGNTHTCAKVTLGTKYDGAHELDLCVNYLKTKEPSVLYEYGTLSKMGADKTVKGDFCKPDLAIINFVPEFGSKKLELVFVVDRSDSMHGQDMQYAKECLLIFLKSLPADSMFQIYGFGSFYDKAFLQPALYNDASLKTAMDYHKKMAANYDLTDFMQPLKNMYSYPLVDGYYRVVFLLTDGDVDNRDEVVQLIKENNHTTTVNCIGIGNTVSEEFMKNMAKVGLGKSAVVKNSQNLTAKFTEIFDNAVKMNEFIVNKIDWQCPNNASIVTIPAKPEPVRQNSVLNIYCIVNDLRKDDTITGKMMVTYNGTNRIMHIEIQAKDGGIIDGDYTGHHLLAKNKIVEMIRQVDNGRDDLKEVLIKLSTESNVETEYTSMVAVDQLAPNKGQLISERVDPLLYYRPIFDMMSYSNSDDCNSDSAGASSSSLPIQIWIRDDVKMCTLGDIVIYIAAKQNIDGSFDYDHDIIWRLGLDLKTVEENQPDLINNEIWMTTIVFEFMATKLKTREKEWQLLGKKAKELISIHIKESSIVDRLQGTDQYDGARDVNGFIQYITKKALLVLNETGIGLGHITSKEIEIASSADMADRKKYEIVFVIDRSGSMQGVKIESAKQCLFIFLKSLPDNCKFQIYGFGSQFDKAFNAYEIYDDDNIQKGLAYQQKIDASFGGTELINPLSDLFGTPVSSGFTRLVFVLTDGQISNESQAVQLVSQYNKSNRLFTIGIGRDVSVTHIQRLAEAGLGKAAFVEESSILSSIVIDLLNEALNMA